MSAADLTAQEVACWRMYGLQVCPHYFGFVAYDPRTQEGCAVYA